MEGPRSAQDSELTQLIDFLTQKLRTEASWSIASEYPTTLSVQNLHNMRIIKDKNQVVSHAVLKPLIIKNPHLVFKVGAIGSVVTDEAYRQQGLGQQIINDCIEQAEKQNCDIAILWTNLYDFYRKMNFELAGSEISFVIDRPLTQNLGNYKYLTNSKIAPEALLRVYSQHTVASARTLDEVKKFLSIPNTQVHSAWDTNNQLAAYAIEGKGADLNGYIHEWGGSITALLGLLTTVFTTQKQTKTLIVPRHSKNLIEKLDALHLIRNDGFLGMIKLTQFDQLSGKIKRAFRAEGIIDMVLEKRPNGYWFGIGQEILTVANEADVVRLLFGPIDYKALHLLSPAAVQKIEKILPLPLWVWGWDSV